MRKVISALVVAALVGSLGGGLWVYAQDGHGDHGHGGKDHGGEKAGHSHEAAEVHGGDVTMTEGHHFEVVFHEGGIHVYPYGPKQEMLSAKGLTGTAKLMKKGADKAEEQKLTYVAADAKKGIFRDYLQASFDLKGVEKGSAKVTIDIAGLANKKEPKVSFTVTFNGHAAKVEYVCPMKCEGGRGLDPAKCPKCKMEMKKAGAKADDHKGGDNKGDDHKGHDHGHK